MKKRKKEQRTYRTNRKKNFKMVDLKPTVSLTALTVDQTYQLKVNCQTGFKKQNTTMLSTKTHVNIRQRR